MSNESNQQASENQPVNRPWLKLLLFIVTAAAVNAGLHYLVKKHFVPVETEDFATLWNAQTQAGKYSVIGSLIAFPVGILLIVYGLVAVGRRVWIPFAVSLAAAILINVVPALTIFLGFYTPGQVVPWFVVTGSLSFLLVTIGLIRSLRDHILVRTLARLITGTTCAVLVTLLFPFILLYGAFYLKKKRNLKFREVWKQGPHLYNFFIVNVYPIFFEILPGISLVKRNAKRERKENKKKYRHTPEPVYHSSIELENLVPGDVILTGKDSWGHSIPIQASNLLSNGEEYRYWSHAAIYAGNGNVIEAQSNGKGVIETSLSDYYFTRGFRLMVLRHNYLDEDKLRDVVEYCREKKDENCEYDTWGVTFYSLCALVPPMLSGWLEDRVAGEIFNVKNAYFCSELVAEAFEVRAQKLFNRAAWRVKPLDFRFNPLFSEVDCRYKKFPVEA